MGLFLAAKAMFGKLGNMRLAEAHQEAKTSEKPGKDAQKKIDVLLARLVEAERASGVAVYEKQIAKLERERLPDQARSTKTAQPRHAREDLFELTSGFLSSPYDIYKKAL